MYDMCSVCSMRFMHDIHLVCTVRNLVKCRQVKKPYQKRTLVNYYP